MNAIKDQIRKQFAELLKFTKTEKFLVLFSLLPLLWTWLPVLSFHSEKKEVRKFAIYSGIMTVVLFAATVLSSLLDFIPVYGGLVAGLVHLTGVMLYAGVLVYFFTMNILEKPVYSDFLNPALRKIETFL